MGLLLAVLMLLVLIVGPVLVLVLVDRHTARTQDEFDWKG